MSSLSSLRIKIGPILYQVLEVPKLTDDSESTKLSGHIKYDLCEIRLESSLQDQAKLQVLWHEIIHAILTHSGIEEHDEKLIDLLAYGVMGAIIDNPALLERHFHARKA